MKTPAHSHPGLDKVEAKELLHAMLRIRHFEEKCAELYSAGKIRGFLHLYVGEEANAVGAITMLEPEDAIVATYREHGHALTRGVPMPLLMAEMYGKREGCSGGHGGSMHVYDKTTRFYGGNAIVGGGLPLAVGLGLADKMQQRPNVTACFFGEGAVAEGEFHESMNLADLWQLPVLFLCENNLYAMGTALDRSEAVTDITKKVESYAMPAKSVDGMDVLAVRTAVREALDAVRETSMPHFLELHTYRFRAHSMFDAERYREKSEIEEWKKRDPITTFTARLLDYDILHQDDIDGMVRDIDREIAQAVDFAENGTWEPVEDLLHQVYAREVAS
jgi:pyruvate dehydrogenase E1 component alpha subunit